MNERPSEGHDTAAANEPQPASAGPGQEGVPQTEAPLPPPVDPAGGRGAQGDSFGKTALQLAITVALAVGVFYILQFLLAALGIGGT